MSGNELLDTSKRLTQCALALAIPSDMLTILIRVFFCSDRGRMKVLRPVEAVCNHNALTPEEVLAPARVAHPFAVDQILPFAVVFDVDKGREGCGAFDIGELQSQKRSWRQRGRGASVPARLVAQSPPSAPPPLTLVPFASAHCSAPGF